MAGEWTVVGDARAVYASGRLLVTREVFAPVDGLYKYLLYSVRRHTFIQWNVFRYQDGTGKRGRLVKEWQRLMGRAPGEDTAEPI